MKTPLTHFRRLPRTKISDAPLSEEELLDPGAHPNITILRDHLPPNAPYAVPSDLPKPLRDTIRQLHHERAIDFDNIAWMFSLPPEWVQTICEGLDLPADSCGPDEKPL